ncbi:MAG: P1 family peptidase [Chloroflexota bacterium]
MKTNNTLTAVPGIRVGHATDLQAITGCTVILCPPATVAGVDQRGGAPGTRETDLLRPLHLVEHVNAIVLAGGSAFGLAAADGVVRYLDERHQGYKAGQGYTVPIVPAAIVFDLDLGDSRVRPDARMGYQAAEAATGDPVAQGNVGAGTGCKVGALMGPALATKGGLGSAAIWLDDELVVAALAVVNSVGDVIDRDGTILAGLRDPANPGQFLGILNAMRSHARLQPAVTGNTVLGVVATNALLTCEGANKVAQMAHDGLARAINPAHTMYDGDTIFALATGQIPADTSVIGAFAAEAMAEAIRNGVRAATTVGGVRAWND